jgi:hypothetical protein
LCDYVNGLIRENVIALLLLLFPCPCLDIKSVGVAIKGGEIVVQGFKCGFFGHIYCRRLTWTHIYDTLANEVMTWCLCGNDMAQMVMTNGDVDWAHHLIRESHVPTLESVFPIWEHTFHMGNATFPQWNDYFKMECYMPNQT